MLTKCYIWDKIVIISISIYSNIHMLYNETKYGESMVQFKHIIMIISLMVVVSSCYKKPDPGIQPPSLKSLKSYAQIESNPPYGTLYGDADSSWTAQGDEYLYDGYWVVNNSSNRYEIDVFENALITCEKVVTIRVVNPSGVTYKDGLNGWVSLTSTANVSTDSLKTNSTGTCGIIGPQNDDELEIGGDEPDK